jgi:hypothetical protein
MSPRTTLTEHDKVGREHRIVVSPVVLASGGNVLLCCQVDKALMKNLSVHLVSYERIPA